MIAGVKFEVDLLLLPSLIAAAEGESKRYPAHSREVFTAILAAGLVLSVLTETQSASLLAVPKEKPLTAGELFASANPRQDVDRVLLAAFCLDSINKLEAFTSEDLSRCLKEAKVPALGNVSLALLRNARKGRIVQNRKVGAKIFWTITQTGRNTVRELIQSAQGETL